MCTRLVRGRANAIKRSWARAHGPEGEYEPGPGASALAERPMPREGAPMECEGYACLLCRCDGESAALTGDDSRRTLCECVFNARLRS